MTMRLVGSLSSNYCNIAKVVLLEKGVSFAEAVVTPDGRVLTRERPEDPWSEEALSPEHHEELAQLSPAGRVPVLDLGERGALTETSVIVEFLEESLPDPALLPSTPFERARVRELMRHMELYVELVGRRLAPFFYGQELSAQEVADVKPLLERGFASVARLAVLDPYIAGDTLSLADVYARYALGPAVRLAQELWAWDVKAEMPGLGPLWQKLDTRASFQKVEADKRAEAPS